MGRARGDGNTTPYAVATVLFAILFVFSLILAIVFYSRLGKAESTTKGAQQALRRFISPDQERQQLVVVLQNQASQERKSVYGLLHEQISDLKGIIAGSSDSADVNDIRKQWEDLVAGTGTAYVAEVLRLKTELKAQKDDTDDLRAKLESAEQRALNAVEAKVAAADDYKTARQKDENEYNALRVQFEEQMSAFEVAVTTISDDLNLKLHDAQSDHEKAQLDVDTHLAQIRKLQDEIGDLQTIVAGREKPTDLMAMVEHDGRIESLVPDEHLAYIDIGRLDHMQPGITFEVYGRNELVKLDQFGELPRGKATIEVIGVSEVSSKARIVRSTPGQPVFDGDKIYNIVYDRNTHPVFYVFGKFDIHGTGRGATHTDRHRVEAMVLQYRGTLAKQLTFEVDYLVLGVEPTVPVQPTDEQFRNDPAVLGRYEEAKDRYDEYQALINLARELQIPVLNQNRFLTLVGHYRR